MLKYIYNLVYRSNIYIIWANAQIYTYIIWSNAQMLTIKTRKCFGIYNNNNNNNKSFIFLTLQIGI